jgi:hypothetical protein
MHFWKPHKILLIMKEMGETEKLSFTYVCRICSICINLNTFSLDSPNCSTTLSVTFLTGMASSSAILVRGTFGTLYTLFSRSLNRSRPVMGLLYRYPFIHFVCYVHFFRSWESLACHARFLWPHSMMCLIKSTKKCNNKLTNFKFNSMKHSVQY